MPYLTTARAIAAELQAVPDRGHVHITEKHLRDRDRIKSLFAVDPNVPDEKAVLSGWTINRETVSEEWETTCTSYATETWVLRYYRGFEREHRAEPAFDTVIDATREQFRPLKSIGDLEILSAIRTAAIGTANLGGFLCHYAELELTAGERFYIPTADAPPDHYDSIATPRESTADVGEQLAGYIADLTGRVHIGRRLITSRDDIITDLTVQADGLPIGQRDIRVWQVYRDNDAEDAGIALRVETDSAWKLQAAWQWSDAVESGLKFQDHIDAVRERIRGLQNLGNRVNPTLCESSPLQIHTIEGRMLGSNLVHYADCGIEISEVVHA